MNRHLTGLVVFTLLAAPAWADTTLEVGNGAKIKSSLQPATEVETFLFDAPQGAALSITASSKKKGPPLEVHLFDRDDAEIAVTEFAEKGLGARLKKFMLPSSGRFRLTVTSRDDATSGDYGLKIAWKSAKTVGDTVEFLAGSFPGTPVQFSADSGATVSFKATAGKGSTAVPRIVALSGPSGTVKEFTAVGKGASDRTEKLVLPDTGDYALFVEDTSSLGGAVKVSAKIGKPKLGKGKIDLRTKVVGAPDGQELVVGQVLGTDGGSVAIPVGGGLPSPIEGSGVMVPGGALRLPTAVVVGTAPDIRMKKTPEVGVGPAVFFGPEGQSFATPVTVTIPFDAASFDGDINELQVFTRDARGKVTLVPPPYTVNEIDGTVSFASSHFSSFRVFEPGLLTNLPFVGVWKEQDSSPGFTGFLEIFPDGTVIRYFQENFGDERFCSRFEDFPPGTDLAMLFTLEGNELVGEFGERYRKASARQLPRNCDEPR